MKMRTLLKVRISRFFYCKAFLLVSSKMRDQRMAKVTPMPNDHHTSSGDVTTEALVLPNNRNAEVKYPAIAKDVPPTTKSAKPRPIRMSNLLPEFLVLLKIRNQNTRDTTKKIKAKSHVFIRPPFLYSDSSINDKLKAEYGSKIVNTTL